MFKGGSGLGYRNKRKSVYGPKKDRNTTLCLCVFERLHLLFVPSNCYLMNNKKVGIDLKEGWVKM